MANSIADIESILKRKAQASQREFSSAGRKRYEATKRNRQVKRFQSCEKISVRIV
jgi:hypothetical protein